VLQQELKYQPPLQGGEEQRRLEIIRSTAQQRKGLAVLMASTLHRALVLLPQAQTDCNYARLGQVPTGQL